MASVVVAANITKSLCTLGSLIRGILSNCLESPNDSPFVISGLGFLGRLTSSKLEFEPAGFTSEEVVVGRSILSDFLVDVKEISLTEALETV